MEHLPHSPEQIGRYALGPSIASGGMGTLHLGRLVGSAGFARMVAIKRLHPHLCVDPSFVDMFADEARLAARVRHPNVVPTLDVVNADGELLLVMEYVDGESLAALAAALPAGERVPLPLVVAIVSEMLHGLHSAHEAKSESGQPLGIVHRDVSPQNVLVGADGVARLVDFGIARATNRSASTGPGDLKGKLAYMAPEQLRRENVTRKADIFAAGVVLWELLTGTRLFQSDNADATIEKILVGWVAPPSSIARDLPKALDDIALRALDSEPSNRFETAREMAVALEDALGRALGRDVATWVEKTAEKALTRRRELVAFAEGNANVVETANAMAVHERPPTGPRAATAVPSNRREPGPSTLELEPTVTAFAATNEPLIDRPVHRADSLPPPRAPRPRGRLSDKEAFLIFAVAATITVFFGARYGNFGARPSSAVVPSDDSTAAVAAAVGNATMPAVDPNTPNVTPAVAAPLPTLPTLPTLPSVAETSHPAPAIKPDAARVAIPQPASASIPAARRASKVRYSAPTPPLRTPCVAKIDPATQKKVYQGDCD
jgi:eukaryotic-like serine/threonine-protein kinase